jgi:hypothetical protein
LHLFGHLVAPTLKTKRKAISSATLNIDVWVAIVLPPFIVVFNQFASVL